MKISSFYLCLIHIILVTFRSVSAKSVYDNGIRLRNNEELKQFPVVKRKAINQEQPYFGNEEGYGDSSFSNEVAQPLQRIRRVESSNFQPSLEKQLDLKRSLLKHGDKRADRLYKRELNYRPMRSHEEAYGIVYGNGRPIGILEPFPQAYEYAPFTAREGVEEIDSLPAAPRRSAMDILYPSERMGSASALVNEWGENGESNSEDSAKYSDDNYPRVLNNFKVSTRLSNANAFTRDAKAPKPSNVDGNKNKRESKAPAKRSSTGITDAKIAELKYALNRIQNPGPMDKVSEIEDNLQDILTDMGLVDDGDDNGAESLKNKREIKNPEMVSKRQSDKEDEDLEEGANKIVMMKATHEVDKRENKNNIEEGKLKEDEDVFSDNSEARTNQNLASSLKIIDEKETAETEEEKDKRNTAKLSAANYQAEGDAFIRNKRQEANNDLMKGLEKSGDLTMSGNKSPLASSENEGELDKKRNKDQTTYSPNSFEKIKREQDELEYQKQIEQNIQAKIDAIKNQVKREIEALKAKERVQRKKRNAIDTLMEEENEAPNPPEHPEEKLASHIRRKRNLDNSSAKHKRVKRDLSDFSGDWQEQGENQEPVNDYYIQDPPAEGLENLEGVENAKEKRDTRVQSAEAKNDKKLNSPDVAEKENCNQEDKKRNSEDSDLKNVSRVVNAAQENANAVERDKKESKYEEAKQNESAKCVDEDVKKRELKESAKISDEELSKVKAKDKPRDLEAAANFNEKINDEDYNAVRRKRRQVDEESVYNGRNKRASAIVPYAKSSFFPYRSEEEEGGDEGEEFDDDSFDGLQKRDVYRRPDYQRFQDYDYGAPAVNYHPEKRSLANRYVANMNSDVYENPSNYLYNPKTYVRRKRQDNFEQFTALHGGGPMTRQISAVRERNIQNVKDDGLRSKRNFRKSGDGLGNQNIKEEPENIADLSDTDLFGALPQSYDGNNLLRFKRVK